MLSLAYYIKVCNIGIDNLRVVSYLRSAEQFIHGQDGRATVCDTAAREIRRGYLALYLTVQP